MAGDTAGALVRARTLKELYQLLVQLPGLGPFLAFQLAVDLGYAARGPWTRASSSSPGQVRPAASASASPTPADSALPT